MYKKTKLFILGFMVVSMVFFTFTGCKKSSTDLNDEEQKVEADGSKQNSQSDSNEKPIDFTLTGLDGNTVTLSELKGKNVFLNFWATWCPPCTGELPHVQTLYKEYQDKDLVILTVNLGEDKTAVRNFINTNKYTFRVLLDSDQAVADKYQISAIPTSYFINKDGNIVEKKVGGMSEEEMRSYINLLSK